ncbi:MAG: hypothetical protein DME04_13985 [Candidatus Rokuibacteriota bacterium]|nr:MAG: hypothetical protein DME04_13985 [Candidatus Rokubacteria bacterium]
MRAIDTAGNVDASPASFTWTIDTTPPDTMITANPPALTNSTSASFSFTATEAGSTFECKLDSGTFATCTSPQSYSALADGSHTFQVRATDPAGNVDPTPGSFTWTIDTTAPDTTITANPLAVTNSTSASFSFSATKAGSTFECKLDGATFAACTSPQSYSSLAAGSHTFQVRAIDTAGNVDASPASFTWTIDTTAPDTTITANPPVLTNSTSASFSFTATKAGSTFECKLDGAAFAACTSPQSHSALADGSHTFQVRATDPAGNVDATPASFTWTVDTTAPDTTITANPPTVTNSTSATFSFTATKAGSTFECKLDGGTFTTCTSPQSYSSLTAGSHTFQVRAIDSVGNVDPTPASFTWTIDTTAPDTTITAAPPALTSSPTASFSFTATKAGSTFECKLDGAAFSACTSPQSYGALSAGSHTFQVRAIDTVGNVDATPASFTWTIDTTAPDTTITANPPTVTNSTSATFSFTATKAGSTFECKLDGVAFSVCTSPQSYSSLTAGSHTFQVRAIDTAGNVDATPASFTWTIDTTAPDTTITANPPALTNSTSAAFSFTATKAGSTFECKLDGAAFATCTSPQSYSALAAGSHTFQARAIDPAGNVDPTPASFSWTIDTTAPDTTITATPAVVTNSRSASFSFTATEAGSSFECTLDGSPFTACSSPQNYIGLTSGNHTFQVRAIDAAGNVDPTPAIFTWLVDTIAPIVTITSPVVSGPTYNTTSSALTLGGTASDDSGAVAPVTWANDRGGSGVASGTTTWTASGIVLQPGTNLITVTARDAAGNSAAVIFSATLIVADIVPPTVAITSPTSSPSYDTGNALLSIGGTAADNVGVVEITWTNSRGGGGTASGTTSWAVNGMVLRPGTNVLTVTARDAAGNTATATLTITLTLRFTDDPLLPGTPIKAVHFTELRSAVDNVRLAVGLATFEWTDPILAPEVTPARVVYLTDLRTALNQAYVAANAVLPTYTDPIVLPGATVIKVVHITELRSAVVAFP